MPMPQHPQGRWPRLRPAGAGRQPGGARGQYSQAGLGKGGRPRRRRSQGNVCAAARSPSLLPSSWQGFHPGKKKAARIPKTASRASLSASDLHLFGTRSQGLVWGQSWGHTGWDVREAPNRSSRCPTSPPPQEEAETPEESHCWTEPGGRAEGPSQLLSEHERQQIGATWRPEPQLQRNHPEAGTPGPRGCRMMATAGVESLFTS